MPILLRTIPGETQQFICTTILRLNIIFYNEEDVVTCKGHDTVVSLSAGDDKRLAVA